MKELNEKETKSISGGSISHRVQQYKVMKDAYLYTKLKRNTAGQYIVDTSSEKKLLKKGTEVKVLIGTKYRVKNVLLVKVSTLDRNTVGYFRLSNLKRDIGGKKK